MRLNQTGIDFLKKEEGFRAEAYQDSKGVWTIGYGTTVYHGAPVQPGMKITEKEAQIAFEFDTAWAQTTVNQEVKVRLTQNMFNALVSFVYNIGAPAFIGSTLLRMLNQGDYEGASQQLLRWKFSGKKEVLLGRRIRELDLFWT